MCKYCDPNIMKELPEEHMLETEFYGRWFDTCIDEHEDGFYIETTRGIDIPINYCPYCGENLLARRTKDKDE